MANVLTIPNSGIISFDNNPYSSLSTPALSSSARISYDGGGGINIKSFNNSATALDRFSVDGTQGRLFSVTDVLTGILFSVNDITGLPILEVYDTDTVIAGEFNSNTLVVSGKQVSIGTKPFDTSTLSVSGDVLITGDLSATNVIAQSLTIPVTTFNVTSSRVFTNSDTCKIFHFDTTTQPLCAIFPPSLFNGFNIAIMNTGTNNLRLSAAQLKSIGDIIEVQYGGAFIYKDNNQLFAVGRL